jgi:hypothetical protein
VASIGRRGDVLGIEGGTNGSLIEASGRCAEATVPDGTVVLAASVTTALSDAQEVAAEDSAAEYPPPPHATSRRTGRG